MKRVERNDPALGWIDPEQRRIVRVLGHWKDAARIRLEQHLGSQSDQDIVAACHCRKPSLSGPVRVAHGTPRPLPPGSFNRNTPQTGHPEPGLALLTIQ